MKIKQLSILGIILAIGCLFTATELFPGGFDWNRDYVSTLLRGPAGPARVTAEAGVLIFCSSIAAVFARLARVREFSRYSKFIQIGGIGSMVYCALSITPMHDVVVTISIVFLVAAAIPLTLSLYALSETGFFVAGCVCLLVLIAGATIYYLGVYPSILPWAQRATYALYAVWLVSLDFKFPGNRLE